MKTFLEFVAERNNINHCKEIINESFLINDVDKSLDLILEFMKRKIKGNVIMDKIPISVVSDDQDMISYSYFILVDDKLDTMVNFNYLIKEVSTEIYSIDFFDKDGASKLLFEDGKGVSKITLYTLGQSIAYFLPLVIHICNNHDWSISKEHSRQVIMNVYKNEDIKTESYEFYYGAQKYKIYEGLTEDVIEDTFKIRILEDKKKDLNKKDHNKKDDLEKTYKEIYNSIYGGTTDLKDLELGIKHKIKVNYDTDNKLKMSGFIEKNIVKDF